MKGHKKHAALVKPIGGRFHRNEFGLIGAPCGKILDLVQQINKELHLNNNVGYVDADHQAATPGIADLHTHYVDKIDFQQLNTHSKKENISYRFWLNDCDLILVNGNHFKADQQIVFLNSKKKESLQRKLDRLTNVIAFVKDDDEVHDYLRSHLLDWESVPIFSKDDIAGIVNLIQSKISLPKLNGLVLAGGKSMRMGKDKGNITYYDQPQREHMLSLLTKFCRETFVSVSKDSQLHDFKTIPDSFIGLGPFSGILSAMKSDPNAAWLTVACDQPLLGEVHLEKLVNERDVRKLATCFHNPETKFPEPLITIWEPRAYPVLLQYLAKGYSCPRKVLINSDVKEIHMTENDFLMNANTPEEYEGVLKKLSK